MLAACIRVSWKKLMLLKELSNQKVEMLFYKSLVRFWEVAFLN